MCVIILIHIRPPISIIIVVRIVGSRPCCCFLFVCRARVVSVVVRLSCRVRHVVRMRCVFVLSCFVPFVVFLLCVWLVRFLRRLMRLILCVVVVALCIVLCILMCV